MRKHSLIAACLGVIVSFAAAVESGWEWHHKPINGIYGIYGGGLGDPVAPTKDDKKIMFSLRDAVAKDLFESIDPDVKDACTAGSKVRVASAMVKTWSASGLKRQSTFAASDLTCRPEKA